MDKQRDSVINGCLNNAPGGRNTSRVTNDSVKEVLKAKIKTLLEEKKAYLDPSLSLQKFSSLTSTNITYMSNTINDCFNCSFRTLLNKYRVAHAISVMTNEGGLVKDLFAKCGFASRSAFYSSFKTITTMTPLQYLKHFTSDNGPYRKWEEI